MAPDPCTSKRPVIRIRSLVTRLFSYKAYVGRAASKLIRRCDSQLPAQPVIMQHHLNKERLMKRKVISLSIAALAIAVSSVCVIGTVRAQIDSGIGTNPHLRSQSTGQAASSPGAATVVKMSQKDVNFIQKAAGGGAQEVANGKMAEQQAKSAEVKSIAARMVADHTRINKELTALANRKGVTFNTSGVRAQNLGTGNFDALYLKWLEEVHRADIADFERAAKSADDSELKSWVSKTLPTLKQHLAMIQAAEKKVGAR
jgi:putative membrane protein